jgi:hypothetical protein
MQSIEGDSHSGRQITGITQNNIEAVSNVIMKDPHSIYNQIEAYTSLSRCIIYNIILHKLLKLRKVVAP